jgi:hypothetical protein
MSITHDVEFLPLLVVTHVGVATDDEFARHLAAVQANMYGPRAGRRIVIHDATWGGPTSAVQRRMQADWLKAHEDQLRKLTIASVFVIPSTFVRGVLTAILWLQPLPTEHHVTSTLSEALDWADKRLMREGLAVQPRALATLLSRSQLLATQRKTGT